MKKVYIGGPLFTEGDRKLLEDIDRLCTRVGLQTYLPHRDAGLFERGTKSSRRFFLGDLSKLDEVDLIIAVLNGIEVDSGTSFEMGYAHAKETPIIGYVNDTRIYDPQNQLNPMIMNSLHSLTHNLQELEEVLHEHK